MKKSAARIIRTIGTTCIPGLINFNPSTADVTVMDGVITPSAKSAAPPIIVSTAGHEDFCFIRAKRAKIPPSPLLSARRVISTYFIVVESVRVQKIQESPPYMSKMLKFPLPPVIIALIV